MISLRLPHPLEQQLNRYSKLQHQTKSQVVKNALEQYFKIDVAERSPYELGKELFGKYSLGDQDLSKNYKKILKAKINEKHNR